VDTVSGVNTHGARATLALPKPFQIQRNTSPAHFERRSLELEVVIPAYNEARSIEKVIANVRAVFPCASVTVVNDGSGDDTAERARSAGATVIELPFNLGYGAALHTGLIRAYREGARLVLTMDADGQHEAAAALRMVATVSRDEADVVLGSRYLPESRCYRVPVARRLGSWIFAQVLRLLTHVPITDPTTGFQCLGEKALKLYARLPDFPEKTPDADLVLFAHRCGCRVQEVPVAMYEDQSGDSMHGLIKSMFYVPKMLTAVLGMLLMKGPQQVERNA
jgi:glycosyltransferase involved in cell wall biosynthesis